MVAKLGFRKLNLIWQLSLEMLSLLRSKAHWIKYQSGCRSVLCVLEPINYTFLGSKDPFIRGAWQTLPSRVLCGKEEEKMSFENYKTLVRGLGLFIPSNHLRNYGFLSNWNTESLFDGSHSSLPTATHNLFAKTFWRKITFIWILRIKTASKQN